jgi:hypothetical protein
MASGLIVETLLFLDREGVAGALVPSRCEGVNCRSSNGLMEVATAPAVAALSVMVSIAFGPTVAELLMYCKFIVFSPALSLDVFLLSRQKADGVDQQPLIIRLVGLTVLVVMDAREFVGCLEENISAMPLNPDKLRFRYVIAEFMNIDIVPETQKHLLRC